MNNLRKILLTAVIMMPLGMVAMDDGENHERKWVFVPIVGGRFPGMEAYDLFWKRILHSDLPEDLKEEAFKQWDDSGETINGKKATIEDASALANYYIDLANKRKEGK